MPSNTPPPKPPPPSVPVVPTPKLYPHVVPWSVAPVMLPFPQLPQSMLANSTLGNSAYYPNTTPASQYTHVNTIPPPVAARSSPKKKRKKAPPKSTKAPPPKPPPPPQPTRSNLRSQGQASSVALQQQQQQQQQESSCQQAPMNLTNLIGMAFVQVMKSPQLRNKWLTATGIISIIKKRYTFPDDFTETKFHSSIAKYTVHAVDIQDATNPTGIFRIKRDLRRDEASIHGKRWLWLYYVTDPGGTMGELPMLLQHDLSSSDEQKVSDNGRKRKRRPVMEWGNDGKKESGDATQDDDTTTSTKKPLDVKKQLKQDWEDLYKQAQEVCDQEVERRSSTRHHVKDKVDIELERSFQFHQNQQLERRAVQRAKQERETRIKVMQELKLTSYFDSGEAKALFRPKEGESVQACLQRRIELLSDAINDSDGYHRVVAVHVPPQDDKDGKEGADGNDGEKKQAATGDNGKPKAATEEVSDDDKKDEPSSSKSSKRKREPKPEPPTLSRRQLVLYHCMYLRLTYMHCLDYMDKGKSFTDCCKLAIADLKRTAGITLLSNENGIAKLNRDFRDGEMFSAPKPRKSRGGRKSKGKDESKYEDAADKNPTTTNGTAVVVAPVPVQVAAAPLPVVQQQQSVARMPPTIHHQYEWTSTFANSNRFM